MQLKQRRYTNLTGACDSTTFTWSAGSPFSRLKHLAGPAIHPRHQSGGQQFTVFCPLSP